eukprot:2927742-Pleurochrysis_carterae.AAC.6
MEEEDEKKEEGVVISIHGPAERDEEKVFDDAEMRAFYTQLPDLKCAADAHAHMLHRRTRAYASGTRTRMLRYG